MINETEYVENESVFISDKLAQILHNGFSYNFEYDSYGMMTKTKVGSVDLVTNEYNNNTHMLTKSTYGNGTVFEPVYDSDYQLIGKKYGGSLAYEYVYSDQGELTTVRDIVNANTTNFLYDLSGRLVKTTDTLDNKWEFGYDTHSNMNSIDKTQFGLQEKESITFNDDNMVTNFTLHQGTVKKLDQTIVYDAIGRIESIGTNKDETDTLVLKKDYSYWNGEREEENVTTTLVSKEKSSYLEKDYTYDLKGNITSITVGGNTISYTYDLIGQLLTEDNEVTGEYIVYDYDTGGNIQSKTVTLNGGTPVVYNYGYDSVWKDKLVSFDGKSLTYDAIGNPLTIGDSVLTWTQGRKLSTYQKDATSETATYTYDENGIRKTKTVGDEVIEYITSGGEVVAQRSNNGTTGDSSDDVVITYTRGADGSLISMNRNGTIYYYVTNIQGDVEKILTSSGTVVVEYIYDAYGRVVSISGTYASTIGEENPFRYRSYYFDNESGYYYLQSRYYDPVTCRMLNADDRLVDNGNMFSYCSNNPVNQIDPDGHWPKWLTGTLSIISGVSQVIAGVALGATAGWTGIGAAIAAALIVNGVAEIISGGTKIYNTVRKKHYHDENLIRTASKKVGSKIGGKTGEKIGSGVYDIANIAAAVYSIAGGGATALSKTASILGKTNTITKEFNLFSKGTIFFDEYAITYGHTIKSFVNLPKTWFRVVNGIGAGVDSLINGKNVYDSVTN